MEVGALVAVGYWGWNTGSAAGSRWALMIAAVVAVIVVWGLFVSPKPTIELARPARLLIELVVWAAAAASLWFAGLPTIGVVFFVVAAASGIANHVSD